MIEIERRIVSTTVELHGGGEGTAPVLIGYAALYDSVSEDLGGFVEVVRPGAFDRSIRENQDVLARAEHDSRMLLGRRASDTLRLSVDEKGLRYEIDVPDTQAGRDTVTLVKRGDVRQSSFAFLVPPGGDRFTVGEDGSILRELLDVDLIDVAPVAMPAYTATSVSTRALEQAREVKPPPRTDADPPVPQPAASIEILRLRNELASR